MTGDRPQSQIPTTVAAMPPRYSCPSPPTLNRPALAPTAVARPVRQRVSIFARVFPNTLKEPKAPFSMALYPAAGLYPVTSISSAPMIKAARILRASDMR